MHNVGWQVVADRKHFSGVQALYYGDPTQNPGNFIAVDPSGEAAVEVPSMGTAEKAYRLPAGKSVLEFWVFQDVWAISVQGEAQDLLTVEVEDQGTATTVWSASQLYRRWTPVQVDLSAWAGKQIIIRFRFDTGNTLNNDGEGVFLDDIALLTGC